MKTLTQNIQQRTGLSKDEYENVVFSTYLMCLSEIARTPQHLQLLLINRPINNWFLKEVAKLNKDFMINTIPFIKLEKKYVKKHYKSIIKRIAQNYPSALIDAVKIINKESLLTLCN